MNRLYPHYMPPSPSTFLDLPLLNVWIDPIPTTFDQAKMTRGKKQLIRMCTTQIPHSSYFLGIRDDYMPIAEELTVLTFTSGTRRGPTSRRCRAVPVIDDNAVESDETFTAVLNHTTEDFAAVNISNGFQSATVTIMEDINDREYRSKKLLS